MPEFNAEPVLDAKARIGECPIWSVDEQCLYWIDIDGKIFNRFDPATGQNRRWDMPEIPGSFVLREGGGITIAMQDGIHDFDPATEPIPTVGDHSVILDGEGRPVCIIRTTSVEIRPFGEVDAAFAWDEGEGDRSLDDWRRGHAWYFASVRTPIDDSTPLVLERFEKVWPPPADATRTPERSITQLPCANSSK